MKTDLLEILFDKMPSAVFVCDRNINVIEINSSFRKMFKNSPQFETGLFCGNTIGCSYVIDADTVCGETEYCATCKIRKAIEKAFLKDKDTDGEIVHRDFYINGKKVEKYFKFSTKLVIYKNDNMVMIVVDDITELEKKKLEVIDIDRQKNKVIASISHDLQGPLSAVIGFADTLKEKAGDDFLREFGDYIGLIREAVDNSLISLDNLIDYSRIHSSSVDLNYKKFRPVETFRKTLSSNILEAEKKGISFKMVCDDDNIVQIGDVSKIWHTFDNLVRFSINQSKENSFVLIRCSSENDTIKTEINFKPQKDIPGSITDLFTEGSENIDKTNLGIALAIKFVRSHGGSLGLTKNGEHSVLSITVPSDSSKVIRP